MTDYFSNQAKDYAKYRPSYPDGLFRFIYDHVKEKNIAWDCATGNGQIAAVLGDEFQQVYATDISREQLKNAKLRDNLTYGVGSAEESGFPDNTFNLITVGQAIHWLEFDLFYKEAVRVAAPGCFMVIVGYDLPRISMEADALLKEFYNGLLGPYWDPARKYIDDQYRTIPFPFKEVIAPGLEHRVNWSLDDVAGYLSTWSAIQRYSRETGRDPLPEFISALEEVWPDDDSLPVSFPILVKAAYIK